MKKKSARDNPFQKWDKSYFIQLLLSIPFIAYGGGRGIVPYILHTDEGNIIGLGLFITGIICLSVAEITFHLRKIYFKLDEKTEK